MFANCFFFVFRFFFFSFARRRARARASDGFILRSKMRQKARKCVKNGFSRLAHGDCVICSLRQMQAANKEEPGTKKKIALRACVFCFVRLKRNDAQIKNTFALHVLAYIAGP